MLSRCGSSDLGCRTIYFLVEGVPFRTKCRKGTLGRCCRCFSVCTRKGLKPRRIVSSLGRGSFSISRLGQVRSVTGVSSSLLIRGIS